MPLCLSNAWLFGRRPVTPSLGPLPLWRAKYGLAQPAVEGKPYVDTTGDSQQLDGGLAHATCEQDALVAELLGVVEPWGLVADLKKQSSAVVP